MSDSVVVSPDALQTFVSAALTSQGVPADDAAGVARLISEADMLGYETHGVFRLRQYLARLEAGGYNTTAKVRIVQESAATALIDGDNGLGHLAMDYASQVARQKARESGIGWVGIRRGNHAGPLALYVRPQARDGMIGMAAAVGSANHVPPYGTSDILLGTNPLAVAAPGKDDNSDPFVLDMATTVASMGKIKTLAQRGESMPEGWMVSATGEPLTDPARRDEGFMLPVGGHKGFGLSVAIGILAGLLNGAAFGKDVVDFTGDKESETNTGQFVMALNIEAFMPLAQFRSSYSRVVQELCSAMPLPGYEPVRMPGQGKESMLERHNRAGVPLNPSLVDDLNALAAAYGFARLAV